MRVETPSEVGQEFCKASSRARPLQTSVFFWRNVGICKYSFIKLALALKTKVYDSIITFYT